MRLPTELAATIAIAGISAPTLPGLAAMAQTRDQGHNPSTGSRDGH